MSKTISQHPENQNGDRYEVRYFLRGKGEVFSDSFEDFDLAFENYEEVIEERFDKEPLLLDCNVFDLKTGKLWAIRAQTGERFVSHKLEFKKTKSYAITRRKTCWP